jgi:hypothetical protein
MSDPFADYGKRAASQAPAKLLGPIKTRAEMRNRYNEILALMAACETVMALEELLSGLSADITQFHAEHEFFWSGDGDFLGLEREIERARARVDDRLDMPRWEN